MEQIEITVERRIRTGKNVSRRLRAEDRIPGIVYGLEQQSVPIEIDGESIRHVHLGESTDNQVFLLKMQGTDVTRHVIVKSVQQDPVRGGLLHVDFLRIDLESELEVDVPVHVAGTAAGAKQGGVLEFVHREVQLRSLPLDLPTFVEADVTKLEIGDTFRAKDLTLPEKVTLLTDPEMVLAVLHAPRTEETTEEAAAEEGAEAAPAAEGEEKAEGKEG